MESQLLEQCVEANLPVPPFERYIYVLPDCVVKKRLLKGELGYRGYKPEFSTLALRDENEIRAIKLIKKHTNIPVPNIIEVGDGYTILERFHGVTVNEKNIWDRVSPKQREAIKLQVQGYIKQLAAIPNPTNSIRSLIESGEVFHLQLPNRGPFESTKAFVEAYRDSDVPFIHEIPLDSKPVFSHMDWDLSNIILYPNLDAVAGVIDFERVSFFPEGGRAIHKMCHQWAGWEKLFDGLEFPKTN